MSPDSGNPPATPLTPPPVPATPPPPDLGAEFLRWAKILLARNPFYIISAGLLIWSMRRLSLDSRIFSDEFPQLVFNVSSFQLYEFLLAGTAIVLARRRIWYDSGLLIGLENLFLCVPFLLVSQALLLENQMAIALCAASGALALLRFRALRRDLPGLNMPGILLTAGAILLGFNLGWPVMIRMLHKTRDLPAWDTLAAMLGAWQWNWLMPASIGLGFLLPKRFSTLRLEKGEEAPFYAWRSFPLLALFAWVAGTCVHLYCISFVYGMAWEHGLLAPTVWMAAWVLWRQSEGKARRVLVFGPLACVLSAAWADRMAAAAALALVNAAAFAVLATVKRDRLAAHLSVASVLLAAAFAPAQLLPFGSRLELGSPMEILVGGLLVYVVFWAIVSPRAKAGIFGGVCLALGLIVSRTPTYPWVNLAAQVGLAFILAHSLRWSREEHRDADRARMLCAGYWVFHGVAWTLSEPAAALPGTLACAGFVLAAYGIARWLWGGWGPKIVPYSAGLVAGAGPLRYAGEWALRAPDGVLILVGSFALFAVGTLVAFRKGASDMKTPAPLAR